MDLSKTINKNNLVVLKEGVKTFQEGSFNQYTYVPNKFYRSIALINEGHKEVYIDGMIFFNEDFDNNFEFAYDRIIRDFKLCGLIKPNGKPISKTKFKELCNLNIYGNRKQKLFKGVFFTNKDRGMYVFQTNYWENKVEFYNTIYGYFIDIFNGDLTTIDSNYVQYGNCGIGLTFGSEPRVR